jgi:hypothetical protein
VTGGRKYRDLVLQIGGWTKKTDKLPLLKEIVAKSEEVKTVSNLAEYSKESYGSKTAILPKLTIPAFTRKERGKP